MDFTIYIFFIFMIFLAIWANSFSKGNSAALFAFLMALIGLGLNLNSPAELITGTQVTEINGTTTAVYVGQPFIIIGFDAADFFNLVFVGLILLTLGAMYFRDTDTPNVDTGLTE